MVGAVEIDAVPASICGNSQNIAERDMISKFLPGEINIGADAARAGRFGQVKRICWTV